MTIASKLEEIKTAKKNIKNAIQDKLGADLTNVKFVDYHTYIKSTGKGYCTPTLNITYEEKVEYVVEEEVTFYGITKTLDGNTVLTNVPVTYNGKVVATSDSNGNWDYSTTWESGGCKFSVVDSTYGVVCKEKVYPNEKFYDSFENLQVKIDTLQSDETLTLDCNYRNFNDTFLVIGGNNITTDFTNVTIDGNGYTIDGLGAKALKIYNNMSNFTLKNLTIKNCAGEIIVGYGNYSIENCTFKECFVPEGTTSSLIYNYNAPNCTITNCDFINNYLDGEDSSLIYNTGSNFYITQCDFIISEETEDKNDIFKGYMIKNAINTCQIKDCNFVGASQENGSVNSRSLIYTTGDLYVRNCTFFESHATNGGGAIYAENCSVIVNSSVFYANYVYQNGGAIYSKNGHVTIKSCEFDGNYVDEDSSLSETNGYGGAIYSVNSTGLTILESKFTNNKAMNDGGAIWTDGGVYIRNSKFQKNSIVSCENHGGCIYCQGLADIRDSSFLNYSDDLIYLTGAMLSSISGCYFHSNQPDWSFIYCDTLPANIEGIMDYFTILETRLGSDDGLMGYDVPDGKDVCIIEAKPCSIQTGKGVGRVPIQEMNLTVTIGDQTYSNLTLSDNQLRITFTPPENSYDIIVEVEGEKQ